MFPKDQHIVIGHSHGGNIALYALKDQALADKISGVACLSTPFLYATHRDFGYVPPGAAYTGILSVLGLAVAIVMSRLGIFSLGTSGIFFGESRWHSILTFFLIMFIIIRTSDYFFKWWINNADLLMDAMSYPNMPPKKVLIVRAHADEATGLIVSAQFLNWFTTRPYVLAATAYMQLLRMGTRIDSRLRPLKLTGLLRTLLLGIIATIAWLPLSLVIAYFEAFPLTPPDESPLSTYRRVTFIQALPWSILSTWEAITLSILVAGMVLSKGIIHSFKFAITYLPGMLLLPFLAIACAIAIIPLGLKLAFYYPVVEVTAEPVPTGFWYTHQLEANIERVTFGTQLLRPLEIDKFAIERLGAPGLLHGTHSNPQAINAILLWLLSLRNGNTG
jgi:hypothetical protein